MQDPDASPFNAVPAAALLLAGALFGAELLFLMAKSGFIGGTRGGEDWRYLAIERFAFAGEVADRLVGGQRLAARDIARLVTYPFVHYGFTHMVIATVFVLALGKLVAEQVRQIAVPVVFFAASIAGAMAYGLLLDDRLPLVGAYAGAYGLIGAYTWILWTGLGRRGENRLTAFRLIGALCVMQLAFALVFGARNDWVAELTGFATGFFAVGLVAPGGWARLVARMRAR